MQTVITDKQQLEPFNKSELMIMAPEFSIGLCGLFLRKKKS